MQEATHYNLTTAKIGAVQLQSIVARRVLSEHDGGIVHIREIAVVAELGD